MTAQRKAEARSRRPRKPRRMMDARLHAWVADALHRLVEEALGMLTYYADPYSPWQRASNENRNGMIRRYLPKRCEIRMDMAKEVREIVDEINNRPHARARLPHARRGVRRRTVRITGPTRVLHF